MSEPMSVPEFTSEQMIWLKTMLWPRCCHITGEHDPRHFLDGKYVCSLQESQRYIALRKALGLPLLHPDKEWPGVPPEEAVSKPGCYWCRQAQERAS